MDEATGTAILTGCVPNVRVYVSWAETDEGCDYCYDVWVAPQGWAGEEKPAVVATASSVSTVELLATIATYCPSLFTSEVAGLVVDSHLHICSPGGAAPPGLYRDYLRLLGAAGVWCSRLWEAVVKSSFAYGRRVYTDGGTGEPRIIKEMATPERLEVYRSAIAAGDLDGPPPPANSVCVGSGYVRGSLQWGDESWVTVGELLIMMHDERWGWFYPSPTLSLVSDDDDSQDGALTIECGKCRLRFTNKDYTTAMCPSCMSTYTIVVVGGE